MCLRNREEVGVELSEFKREQGDEDLKVTGQIMQGLVGHGEEFNFYSQVR